MSRVKKTNQWPVSAKDFRYSALIFDHRTVTIAQTPQLKWNRPSPCFNQWRSVDKLLEALMKCYKEGHLGEFWGQK